MLILENNEICTLDSYSLHYIVIKSIMRHPIPCMHEYTCMHYIGENPAAVFVPAKRWPAPKINRSTLKCKNKISQSEILSPHSITAWLNLATTLKSNGASDASDDKLQKITIYVF